MTYLMSGVLLWGFLGWLAARWLDAPVLAGLGIVIGGVLGTLAVYLRYGRPHLGLPTSVSPSESLTTGGPMTAASRIYPDQEEQP
jgi:hypothetical protein